MMTARLQLLVVDDNRDGADAMGLLAEQLGHRVHVTYGGAKALEIAVAFQPDLMLVDLAMPDVDGCSLARQIREIPAFAQTKLVAMTGHLGQGHKLMALKAGFDTVLFKPVPLADFKHELASVVPRMPRGESSTNAAERSAALGVARALPIDEARRIRSERQSKTLTEAESRSAICDCFIRFQGDYLGWRPERIHAHFINDLLIIRVLGGLTLAECQLANSASPKNGRDLIKLVRKQLMEVARPMLESMIHEVAGVKSVSMHHDLSTVSGEEMVLFTLAAVPRFETNAEFAG